MIRGKRSVKTACPYCGVGCGLITEVDSEGKIFVRGDADHPANFGRLCSKGLALAETIGLDDRLLFPQINDKRVSWDIALDTVAAKFCETIAKHGPDSVAFYASGQLLTEDYYVANKLMKGFIGSANIDTNSRLCMASSVAGHKRAFGSDTVPGCYEDLELADLVVLVGSNLAWCHPVLYQRIAAAKEVRPEMRIVLIDPRRTATADIADMHLAIVTDGDVALFVGLLKYLADTATIDRKFIAARTTGFADVIADVGKLDLYGIASQTGLSPTELTAFYALFARTQRVVTVYSQGVNQSEIGTDKVNAIINCHLATGRIGKPGMGPFSVTGQPNAMGGREVGGLANMLAAHMEIENAAHRNRVQRFWRSPKIASTPGFKAVDMFRAIGDGRIKAVWIMATNPVVSMPNAGAVEAALRACPFVVVSDIMANTDTIRHAHVRLPTTGWGEKDGTVTNSERRISRQRSFLVPPGEAKPDWWIISEVGKRMGFAGAFAYSSPAQIFAEHAALSGFENAGTRDFDIGAFSSITAEAFDAMPPFQWPRRSGEESRKRFFDDGQYFTSSGKAAFVTVEISSKKRVCAEYPLILNTGRVRDHWHTLTRTGKSPRLSQHYGEPFVEIHPDDAAQYGVRDADLVRVSSGVSSVLVRALISTKQKRCTIFIPMHWTQQYSAWARVDVLATSLTDHISGQPALKNIAVRVERVVAGAYGFAVLAERPSKIDAEYWAIARCHDGWRVELAYSVADRDWSEVAAALFAGSPESQMLAYHDVRSGQHRYACFAKGSLRGALYLAREPVTVSRDWAVAKLSASFDNARRRFTMIAGRPCQGSLDKGATVCSCFGIGANQIATAIAKGCASVAAVGQATQAGTNCGSCRAEIRTMIEARNLEAAE